MNTYPIGNVVKLRGFIGGGSTKLVAGVAAGATAITVFDIAGYSNNDGIVVNRGGLTEERRLVSGVPSGLTIPLSSALLHNHAIREPVAEAATPGTVTCTIKLPNGTTATPTVTGSAGVYVAEHTTTVRGIHYYSFTGSGGDVVATSPEGGFNVDDTNIV